jgi:hypothetical protein
MWAAALRHQGKMAAHPNSLIIDFNRLALRGANLKKSGVGEILVQVEAESDCAADCRRE